MNGTQGTTLFLKLVSFLKLPVYPLQIPKPPSVKLTNEAIKSKVLNSFELHLLSESFNNSTVDSQSSSGLFSTLVLFSQDHQLTLFSVIHFLRDREREREREMNISASEIPPVCDSSVREKFPMFSKKGISALDALVPIPCSILSHLISSLLMPMCLVG